MNSNTKSSIVAILIIVTLALISILFAIFSPELIRARSVPKSNMVNLPLITTQIKSQDGKSHAVDTYISLEFTQESEALDSGYLKSIIEKTLSSLEYERITEPGNIKYIRDEVEGRLAEYIPEDEILGVYVTELQAGEYRISSPLPEAGKHDNRKDIIRSLFNNLK